MGARDRIHMLALFLIEEDSIADLALKTLMAGEIDTIRFRDPLRLLDAVQELRPDALIIRRRDFPLHAQMVAGFVRYYRPLTRCKMIWLSDDADASGQATALIEKHFLKNPSLLTTSILGTEHAIAHRGSRLVAKAQRMMKE